jgi:hypothetical protein
VATAWVLCPGPGGAYAASAVSLGRRRGLMGGRRRGPIGGCGGEVLRDRFGKVPAVPTGFVPSRGVGEVLFGVRHTKAAGWGTVPAREPLHTGLQGKRVRRVCKKKENLRID